MNYKNLLCIRRIRDRIGRSDHDKSIFRIDPNINRHRSEHSPRHNSSKKFVKKEKTQVLINFNFAGCSDVTSRTTTLLNRICNTL